MLYNNLAINNQNHLTFAGYDIRFKVKETVLTVEEVNKV